MRTRARTAYAVALAAVGCLSLVPSALDTPRPLADPLPYGRANDVQPHFGGAALSVFPTVQESDYHCTSGFAVQLKANPRKKGMVTAGHCFKQDTDLGSGHDRTGGDIDFGTVTVVKFDAGVPDGKHDMELITGVLGQSGAQTYAATIWVDPQVPSAVRVVGKGSVAQGDMVCYSGMVTKANCGFEVRTPDKGTLCSTEPGHTDDCTTGLAAATKPVSSGPRKGDSGSPVYRLDDQGNAVLLGMLVGGGPTTDQPQHQDAVMYFHTLRQIESADGLDVTALTQKP
ncbi:hypothetical protein [Streptomyces sp. NPDC058683]|uniref:hypothetical protein n=1 Tax=Streptomyces sp. NPDC058683 TaxID=3346597 RepID=UPI003668B786